MIKNCPKKLTVVLISLLIVPILTGLVLADELDGFTKVVENDYLILFINNDSTEIAVQDKDSENIWYSNPPDRDEIETIARGGARDKLNSQIILNYYLPGNKPMSMNTYSDSVSFQQYEINNLDNGVSIDYTIGKKWSEDAYVPLIIGSSAFEEKVLNNLSESDQKFLLDQYTLLRLRGMEIGESRVDIFKFDSQGVLGDYVFSTPESNLNQNKLKNFIQYFLTIYIENREDISGMEQFQAEDLEFLKESAVYVQNEKILPWNRDKVLETFQKSGYTPEKLSIDYEGVNLTPPTPNARVFEVKVEYRLQGRDLIVKIPVDEIVYPINVVDKSQANQKIDLPVHTLEVLPFFGAANNIEEGYMFVPDGSGAIIELNNNKTILSAYNKSVYGIDYSTEPREELPFTGENINFPVYGIKKSDTAFMAIIEEGDALAAINADIAGRRNSYNYVFPRFKTLPKTVLELGDGESFSIAKLNIYQSRLPEGNIKIRYSFLDGDRANYVGMAHRYQDYLVENYQLKQLDETDSFPFMLELVGAIDEQRPVMGIPRRAVNPLTTFTQMRSILEEFRENQVDSIDLRMTGWTAGGIRHYFPGGANIEEQLGSENDFEDLLDYLKDENIEVYPDISFMNVYRNQLFDAFTTRRHNARFLNKNIAYIPQYNIATYQDEEIGRKEKQIVSSRYLNQFVSGFIEDYSKYRINNLSLRYMGQQLNSDFRSSPSQTIDRQQSLDYTVETVENLNKNLDYKILIEGSNSYLLPYVNNVVKMPLFSTGENIIDRGVPFLPIALHGYIKYSGEPLNMPQNENTLLKYIETGSVPYYQGAFKDSSVVKGTDFDHMYSLNYQLWFDDAISLYHDLDDMLSETINQRIIDHQRLAENVYKTVYSNGCSVIVNYNSFTVNIEGTRVNGEDYIVIQGELE
ncbi:MAG: DUF5696 domain-containing protein [Halanaerobiales bacterium]